MATDSNDLGTVEVLDGAPVVTPGQLWSPVLGEEVERLRDNLPADGVNSIVHDAVAILGRCAPPGGGDARRAGLVVGEVQSGKTASFTTVLAAARDNGFALAVLVAGTTTNLLAQSRRRLEKDLGLLESQAYRRWDHVSSPTTNGDDVDRIASDLEEFLDADPLDPAPMVLITVMKNHTHMSNLAAVLKKVAERVDLSKVTAVVIDDEADQASPNISKTSESATYRNLREIRNGLPCHTLLGYTATPQAPLLIALADELSPEFVCVLRSGKNYTGGQYFFGEHEGDFVRVIPETEIAATAQKDPEPPSTLFAALATYLLGAAATQITRSGDQRSMLIHPSVKTIPHAMYRSWIEIAKTQWSKLLLDGEPADVEDLVDTYFSPAYDDLTRTASDLPPLKDLLKRVPRILRKTWIREINAVGGSATEVNFNEAFSWIVVGGAKLDRGFTVEGLSVTYMPRDLGVGNADSIEQRGRFFGYKRSYAGLCRAWLTLDMAAALSDYVDHENAMRKELIRQAQSGESLKDWRRAFILSPRLKLTRGAVIKLRLSRIKLSDSWYQQWNVPIPQALGDIGELNLSLCDEFCAGLAFREDPEHPDWTLMQHHSRAVTLLKSALDQFLAQFHMVEEDSSQYTTLLLGLEQLVESNPETSLSVLKMSSGRARTRTIQGDTTRLKSLFQGRTADRRYPGDREIHDKDGLTLQIHYLDVYADAGDEADDENRARGELLRQLVPVIALYVPSHLKLSGIFEE